MQVLHSRKEENHDTLCEEILRERAAVLSRAGKAVEDIVSELTKLNHDIEIKINHLEALKRHKQNKGSLNLQQAIIAEINAEIDQFNAVRKMAQLKYYYLIVTREALGLRRHDMIREIYVIPLNKKQVQAA